MGFVAQVDSSEPRDRYGMRADSEQAIFWGAIDHDDLLEAESFKIPA